MSDTIYEDPSNKAADRDDKLFAGLGYALMLLGNIIGVSSIIAVIIGYARRDQAPNWLHSHYEFQIRTFWAALVGLVICTVMIVTIILSPFSLLGYAAIWLWVLIRNIVGFIRLLDGRGVGNASTMWV